MKEFFAKEFYHNTLYDWSISLLIILGSIILGKIIYWFFGKVVKKFTSKTKTKIDDIIVDMVEEPLVFAIGVIGFWYGVESLSFPAEVEKVIGNIYHMLIAINVTWLIARLLDALIEEYVVPLTEKTESDFDDQILPIFRKGLRSVIWALGVIVGLNNAGYDVTAMIAGLGIGGLALAMAAKDSLSNIFGGVTVFTDKPFKVNDRIKIDGFDGTITEIGIRTSRLKTLEGRVVTIPNSKFTGNMVENISEEPSRKVVVKIGLTYDMSADQIENSMKILKSIAEKNKNIESAPTVGFNDFGDFSLGIIFIYYIKKGADIINTQTEVNLAILREFEENKLEMAFPTQTIYTKSI